MIKYLFIIFILNFLVACQSAKDALTLKKKNNADEFLIEKKSPLVLPPEYGKLPKPQNNNMKEQEIEKNDIQISLSKEKLKINETIKNTKPTSIEKSVLSKIK